jgi:glycerol-3-phosphate dehydrogenase (NAD(P)+)
LSRAIQVTVLGAGSWGTTVGSLVAANASSVVWARDGAVAEEICSEHRNGRYLPDLELHPGLRSTASLESAVESADVLVMAVPSQGMRAVLEEAARYVRPWIPVVSLAKGLEQGTRCRPTEVIAEVLPDHPAGVLAGPNLAREVLAGYAAASVIAMPDEHIARSLQALFSSRVFRVYTATDVLGCELGGVVKNVIAIAAGMAEGLGVGDNTRATVVARGLAEITRLGVAVGADPRTFAGLTGLGDLIATCMSPLSRNRYVGEQVARGRAVAEVMTEMKMVAEGVKSARAVVELASAHGVVTPIMSEVDAVVNGGRSAADAFRGLRRVPPRSELQPA